ncbi:hypothetical protein K7X08_007295 [Anisodus acutangulus]|uniref:Peptidase S8/S53 domain-containing protein n=1 Tax=Anisodus acutangulus TaxID=402998 RepID=A0A9Q1QZD3_9SOLA|nr:hypothetical protein K7X08_007295 [Anisodus acutangulus]
MPKIFASHRNWHSSIIDTIKIEDPTSKNDHHTAPKLLYSYDNVTHGFSAVLSKYELESLEKSAGFLSAYKDRTVEAHTTHTSEFLKDTDGHGTHVASTAARSFAKGVSYFGYAPGTARGITPRARIAVYKFSFEEGTFTSDLIAAMDQAVADGVDILTISYGWSNIPLYKNSIAITSFGAMMEGVLVSASAGNSGPEMGTLTLGNGLKITAFSLFPVRTTIKELPVLYNESISPCDSSDLLSLIPNAGRSIMICYSGAVEVEEQMAAISESRFGRAIYISDDPDVLTSNYFPNRGVVISTKEGKQVIHYATKSVKPKASISFKETHIDVKPAICELQSQILWHQEC